MCVIFQNTKKNPLSPEQKASSPLLLEDILASTVFTGLKTFGQSVFFPAEPQTAAPPSHTLIIRHLIRPPFKH